MKIGWVGKQWPPTKSKVYLCDVWKNKGDKSDWDQDDYPPVKVVILTWEEYQELKNALQINDMGKFVVNDMGNVFTPPAEGFAGKERRKKG